MHPFAKTIAFFLLPILCLAATVAPAADAGTPETLTLTQLEERLTELNTELDQLARFTPRSGTGAIGWISTRRGDPQRSEWIEISLSENTLIDQIVVVPLLWNDAEKGPLADGFPEMFKIIAGDEDDTEGKVVAFFGPEDRLLPRTAPLVVHIPPMTASWVRIKATQLTPCARDGEYVFSLSEIMVFNGDRNVALSQSVRVSSEVGGWGAMAINKEALTDGFIPFLLDASSGTNSNPHLAFFPADTTYSFTLDLGSEYRLDEIRIHSAEMSEYIPQLSNSDFGVPQHLVIEGANQANFSDAVPLLDYRRDSIYDSGAILIRHVPETRCQHIRLSVPEPYQAPYMPAGKRQCFGLAELEIISNGRNVAKGIKPVFPRQRDFGFHQESITDGCNHYGEILPSRNWMEQLAYRHELERERPHLVTELNTRYARQKKLLLVMYWLAFAGASTTIFIILIDRMLRMRQVARLKQRFAADLHDELGANLHSIGLISDVAQNADSSEQWQTLSRRIRELTERTGTAVRYCTNLMEADDLYIGLTSDMQRAAQRITTNMEHDFTIEGESFLEQLPPRTRIDLFLFYKESLVNICRHSGATQISTRLTGGKKETLLTVCDNGKGLNGNVPSSLKRRGRLLKAKLTAEGPAAGGTCITLRLRRRRWRTRKYER